jgi:hypothetical protein
LRGIVTVKRVMALLGLGISLLIARWLGGFFVLGPFPSVGAQLGGGLQVRNFAAPGAVLGQIQWDLASFGALLILGSVGLFRVRCDKAFLTMLVALPLVIVNMLRYQYTWDIVKFGTVGFIALAIGAGVVLSDLWGWADNTSRNTVCALLIVPLLWQGFLYPFGQLTAYAPESRPRFSVQMIRPYFSIIIRWTRTTPVLSLSCALTWGLRRIVYRTIEKSEPYAIWGGLPTQASVYPADSGNNDSYGLGEEKFAARVQLAAITENWLDRLTAEHVSWVVTDSDDVEINALLERGEHKARVALAKQFGAGGYSLLIRLTQLRRLKWANRISVTAPCPSAELRPTQPACGHRRSGQKRYRRFAHASNHRLKPVIPSVRAASAIIMSKLPS